MHLKSPNCLCCVTEWYHRLKPRRCFHSLSEMLKARQKPGLITGSLVDFSSGRRQEPPEPRKSGSATLTEIDEDAIIEGRDRRANTPHSANNFLKAMRSF